LTAAATPRPRWRGFRGRLLLTHLAVALAVLAGVEIALDRAVRDRITNQLLDEMSREAALVVEAVSATPPDLPTMDALADRMGAALVSRVTIIEPGGRVSGESGVPLAELAAVENHGSRPEVLEATANGTGRAIRWSTTVRRRMLYVAKFSPDGRVVRVARSMEQVDSATSAARRAVLGFGLAAALFSAVLATTVSGALARPIRAVTEAARAMASGDLSRRITMRRSDELGDLADALNDLAASFARTIDEVTEERNRLAAVLAGMVEGVLVVDASGRVVLMNPSLREILDIQSDASGRTVLEAVRSPDLHEAVSAVLGGGAPLARVLTLPGSSARPDGARTIEARFSVLRGERAEQRIAGLVAVFHDITDLKRLEQVRKDFVANASHELKTPVAAILGASETLIDGAANDPVAGPRFLDVIGRHAARLAALVDDLLDLSRLEARAGEAMSEVHPADALSRAAAAFKESAAAKRIELRIVPVKEGPGVRGDTALMDRALTNLVQNAVRYTPAGGTVILRAVRQDGAVRFEVEDTGIGIPPQALARIFERFYRVDPARSRELGGTGLGLAIVKHAVEAMGGTVAVRSVPDHGSTFSFTLQIWQD